MANRADEVGDGADDLAIHAGNEVFVLEIDHHRLIVGGVDALDSEGAAGEPGRGAAVDVDDLAGEQDATRAGFQYGLERVATGVAGELHRAAEIASQGKRVGHSGADHLVLRHGGHGVAGDAAHLNGSGAGEFFGPVPG